MNMYVDTSALLAILDADDQNHAQAKMLWTEALEQNTDLICTNYVLLETIALVQRWLGIQAVRVLDQDVVPVLSIEWVNLTLHALIGGNLPHSTTKCQVVNSFQRPYGSVKILHQGPSSHVSNVVYSLLSIHCV